MLKDLIPMLNVSDIDASLEFYQGALDFEIVSDPQAVEQWRWATIRSGRTELMLAQTESPPVLDQDRDPHADARWPVIFYFYPDDVTELYAGLVAQAYKPTPLIDTIYGMREFSLRDPDGHLLSFGEDIDGEQE
jgi:uncharacterized glyoxalase superfamily protein PhnB